MNSESSSHKHDRDARRAWDPRREGFGRAAGVALAALGLSRYRSNVPTVFGQWSPTYFGIIVAMALGATILLVAAMRGAERDGVPRNADQRRASRFRAAIIDLAIFLWGAAYAFAAFDARNNGGALLQANLFALPTAANLVTCWFVLALLFIWAASWASELRGGAQNAAIVGLALGAGCLIGEAWARGRAIVAPTTEDYYTMTSRMWMRRYARLSPLGFRDSTRRREAIPNVRRLLVVGDSYAFGLGIDRTRDRFGERLADGLRQTTGGSWEVMNASWPALHTLQETQLLRCMLPYRADVVVLLYVFNDMAYLLPPVVLHGPAEAPMSLGERVDPSRFLFTNFLLYQEVYIRARILLRRASDDHGLRDDPYGDSVAVAHHLNDLITFVSIARRNGSQAVVVPFDIAVVADSGVRHRYRTFVDRAVSAGVPIVDLEHAFDGYVFRDLTVNALDRHPNELANRLGAVQATPEITRVAAQPPLVSAAELAPASQSRCFAR